MKTIDANLETAILENSSISMTLEAIIDRSRTYFEELEWDNPYDAGDYSAATDEPVGQCMFYSVHMDKIYTFIIDKATGAIYGMVAGSGTANSLGISANVDTKPSARDNGDGTATIYYWNDALYKATVNLTTLSASGVIDMGISADEADGEMWTIEAGSPTVVGRDRVIFCYKTSRGGMGVLYLDGSFTYHWLQRFMSPNALTETVWTIYTTAVIFKGKVYVYSTDLDTGEVRAVEYTAHKQSWSDIYVAIPADLSRFDVTNAVVTKDSVHLAGHFHRTEDHSDAQAYSLVLRSTNGRTFSWDRFSLLSELGYYFHIATNNTEKVLYASDRNAVGVADMSYFFHRTPLHRVTLDETNSSMIAFNTNAENASLILACADEEMIDNETIAKGNRVQVSLGYRGYSKVKYATYIIDKVNKTWKDGKRHLALQLVSQGVWKANQIAFPFYAEIVSKSSMFDDCDTIAKMWGVPSEAPVGTLDYLSIDFWNSETWDEPDLVWGYTKGSYSAPPHADIKHTHYTGLHTGKTLDLNKHPLLNDYPTITGDITDLRFYGWDTGLSTGRLNLDWRIFAVTAPEDDLEDKVCVEGTLTSTYRNFPKENYSPSPVGTQAGSYPITFSFAGLEVGHKLLYFGVCFSNSTSGYSYFYLERIEVYDGIEWALVRTVSSTAWSLGTPTSELPLAWPYPSVNVDQREYLMSPKSGLQNLMFVQKPYTSFNFNIAAQFGYDPGDEPLSAGTTAWGVVGIAKDGKNYIVARYKTQNNKIELCIVRDGEMTVLKESEEVQITDIMLDHRNGLFRVFAKKTDTWEKVLSHQYDEVTYGVLSTSEVGIMHMGIYSTIMSPGFTAAAFSQPSSDGVCMTTDQTEDVIRDGFPASGKIVIDGIKYEYDGRTTDLTSTTMRYGPAHLRGIYTLATAVRDGITLSGLGTQLTIYKPENHPYDARDLLLGQGNGRHWVIDKSNWSVVDTDNAYLRNRSSHFCDSAVGETLYRTSRHHKCYIGHGLLNVTLLDDEPKVHEDHCWVSFLPSDEIWVKRVVSTQIDHDATVEDMLKYLCLTASIEGEFPGNWTADTLTIGTTPVELAENKTVFPGGCDIRFTVSDMVNGDYIRIAPENLVLSETLEALEFGFEYENTGLGWPHPSVNVDQLVAYITNTGSGAEERIVTDLIPTNGHHDFRLLIHSDFVSMYADGKTIATFALGEENLEWDDDALILNVYSNKTRDITDVTVSELFDWREAIYIESELSISSAISSVIQERPIEINQTEDGNLVFTYRFERDEVTYTQTQSHRVLREHTETEQHSDNAGSDALVNYADICFVSDLEYARTDGFSTRVFRLSNLDTGAKLAAKLILEKARETQTVHSFVMRPDLRLEVGDIVSFTYLTSGTNIVRQVSGVVENINFDMREGSYNMKIDARSKEVVV